jgi:hypothetical protein
VQSPESTVNERKLYGLNPTYVFSQSERLLSNVYRDKNVLLLCHLSKVILLQISCTFSSTDSITKLLINLKHQLPTIRRLPKACRHLAADKLSSIIDNCLSTKSISSFEDLLLFSYRAFNGTEKSDK